MEPKFIIDREKISEGEIENKKNFDDLLKKFKEESIQKAKKDTRLPRLRKLIYSAVIAGAVVICTVTYQQVFNTEGKKNSIVATGNEKVLADNSTRKFIQPPSAKLNVPYSSYKLNTNKGGTLVHKSTSRIVIPKNAFVKKDGNQVTGEVEILYREMHNPVEAIASGIPMVYDSAGKSYDFETAGMIDIKGFSSGEQVFIKQGKKLKVEMASHTAGTEFNLYELDTVNKRWNYLGKDVVVTSKSEKKIEVPAPNTDIVAKEIADKKAKLEAETAQKLTQLTKVAEPKKPRNATQGRKKFILDVDYKEFPELQAYKGSQFELGTENKNYTPELNEIEWQEATITEGNKKGENYILTLKYGRRIEKLVVYPVLEGENLSSAQKAYDKKFKEYQLAVSTKKAEEDKIKLEMEAQIARLNQEMEATNQKLMAARAKRPSNPASENYNSYQVSDMMATGTQASVYRMFSLMNFGVYNTDCPRNKPQGIIVDAKLRSGENILKPNMVYLFEQGRNVLWTFTKQQMKDFSFDTNKSYYMFTSVNDQLFVCDPNTFKKAKTEQDKLVFDFTAITNDVATLEDLKKKLGLV